MKRTTKAKGSGRVHETWGVFLQSDGTLLDTAKSRIGAHSKMRSIGKGMPTGYVYVDKTVIP